MGGSTTVLRRLLANRAVGCVELAFSGFNMAEYGVWVSVLVLLGGASTALVATGLLLSVIALAAAAGLRRVDETGCKATLPRTAAAVR